MPFTVGPQCIDVMDRSCVEECPVDCIYEGRRKVYINPAECIDCGACEPICPAEAITAVRDAVGDRRVFAGEDSRFFAEPLPGEASSLGNPGGATKTGPIGMDTQIVQQWQVTAQGEESS